MWEKKKNIKKDWVLKNLPLLMPRREIDKEEDKTFIYVFVLKLGCSSGKIKIYGST